MNNRDWFLVGTRLIGVWVLFTAVGHFNSYIGVHATRALYEGSGRSLGSLSLGLSEFPGIYLIEGFVFLAFALYLLLGTEHLAGFCYPSRGPEKDEVSPKQKDEPSWYGEASAAPKEGEGSAPEETEGPLKPGPTGG